MCTDVKYSGLLMRDKRFDPFLNDKNFRDNISSTEDSTSGTESLSLSVSMTDGSLEVKFGNLAGNLNLGGQSEFLAGNLNIVRRSYSRTISICCQNILNQMNSR